jgi:hypothetical protein
MENLDFPLIVDWAINLSVWLIIAISLMWVYRDAEKRGKSGCLVTPIVFLIWPFGLVVWSIFRPKEEKTSDNNLVKEIAPEFKIELALPDERKSINSQWLLQIGSQLVSLQEVYQKMGRPVEVKQVVSGYLLRYLSTSADVAHTVLIDQMQEKVSMIAISNHDQAIALPELSAQHGTMELGVTVEGYTYWLFSDSQVAIVAEGRTKDNIVYVQVFPQTLSLDDYQAVAGYSQEIFTYA